MTATAQRAVGVRTRGWVEQVMGLPVSLRLRTAADHDAADALLDRLVGQVFGVLRVADRVFSPYRRDSELLRLRRGELDPADAHPWVEEVRGLTDSATTLTSGLFTATLTGPDGTSGWDPTGLVKGWAVERAAEHLRQTPGIAFAVNAGGDVVCGTGTGVPTGSALAAPWRIGVEDPGDRTRLLGVLPVVRGAVATSGTAARGAHLVDPRTGAPTARRGSVTVTGPDLLWADVWATACFLDPTALDRCPAALAQGYRVAVVARPARGASSPGERRRPPRPGGAPVARGVAVDVPARGDPGTR